MLAVQGLHASYGPSQVLFGVDLVVGEGEAVALLGRNGMGKTTTVRTVMGLLPPLRGSVRIDGRDLTGAPAHHVARAGVGLVPEGRQVFPNLTAHENLVATCRSTPPAGARAWTEDQVFVLFPSLRERRDALASHLSGGEQQMLAIGRALMTAPRLLILDEATEGLAPLTRRVILDVLAQLRSAGQSILVIDKNVAALARFVDRFVVIEKGRVAWSGSPGAFAADRQIGERYLGV
jgi:branched-chain amino acid transport system ATP-binding protein